MSGRLPIHSGFMPANLITLAHFSVSSIKSFPKSAGDKGIGTFPRPVMPSPNFCGTIMVLSSALAQEQLTKADLVQLAVTLGVYDNRCENLAPRLLADVQRMVRLLDKDDVMAAVINEQVKVDRAGEAKWCVALRPVVEKYKDGLFEPVR